MTEGSASGTIAALARLGDLRVWSVIITIFGDAVQPRGGTVSAATLGRIAETMEIRPEALRVALFRLVRDGWIERSQTGRKSFYRLSESGIARFGPATRRIYASEPFTGPLRLAVLAPGAEPPDLPEGAVTIAPGVVLAAREGDLPEAAAILEGTMAGIPDWLRDRLGPPRLMADYARLETALAGLAARLAAGPVPGGLEAATLRLMAIHHWRRLVLRHPDLPARFFPEGWRGESCRAMVLEVHGRLSVIAEPWLAAEIGPLASGKDASGRIGGAQ